MDQLWAPWRLAYVTTGPPTEADPCFICKGLAGDDDRAHLIAWRTPLSVVLLNRFPYNNGHLLVAPRRTRADSTNSTPRSFWRRWKRCGTWFACWTR